MWLLKTRPDLLFTVSLLSRYLQCATKEHYNFARDRPLRYLRETLGHGLEFLAGTGEWILTGSADSDLAGDINTARSTLAGHLQVGEIGSLIDYCKLARAIATCTGQAETYAMLNVSKSAVWLRGLLEELAHPMKEPTVIKTDNHGVFLQSTKAINHSEAKHYRIAQAYIREKVKDGTIAVTEIRTDYNESDLFTKALHGPAVRRHKRQIMGPQSAAGKSV